MHDRSVEDDGNEQCVAALDFSTSFDAHRARGRGAMRSVWESVCCNIISTRSRLDPEGYMLSEVPVGVGWWLALNAESLQDFDVAMLPALGSFHRSNRWRRSVTIQKVHKR